MKKIIVSNYRQQAYIECVKELGHYSDLEVLFDDINVKNEDDVISINPKFKINYTNSLEDAIMKLKLNWFIIDDDVLENKTIELAVS